MATVGAREREERVRKEFEAWQLMLLRDKDFDVVVGLVQARKAILELRDPDFGWTPLLFAADGGAMQLLGLLLDCRAKPEASDEEGNTPLCVAARQGHLAAVQLLAVRKANLDAQNRGGWTPLLWASMSGHDEVAAALLDVRASFYVVDALGRTALMWAARHGHTSVAEALLARGVDFTRRDEDGLNAADHAQEHFELRASIVLAEERNRRLLEAVQRNDVEAVRQTLEAGACVEVPDETGWTPLAWAMLLESRPLVEVLVQHGANPYLLGEEAEIGEQLIVKHSAVVEALSGAVEANGRLLKAARAGRFRAVERELAAGAWINLQDEEDRTALMWAARRGSVRGVNLLIGKGALINARDRIGFTAFLYGTISGNIEVVCLLHHHNADINARSYYGHSALHLAAKVEDAAMVQVLVAAGLEVNEKDYRKRAPAHAAAANGQLEVLHTLVFCHADLHIKDHEMRTPLMLAVLEEQFSICEALLTELSPPEEPKVVPCQEVSEEEGDEEDAGSEASWASGGSGRSRGSKRSKNSKDSQHSAGKAAAPGAPGSRRPSVQLSPSRRPSTQLSPSRRPSAEQSPSRRPSVEQSPSRRPSVQQSPSRRSSVQQPPSQRGSVHSASGAAAAAAGATPSGSRRQSLVDGSPRSSKQGDDPPRAAPPPEPDAEEPYDEEEMAARQAAFEEEERKRLAQSKLRNISLVVQGAMRMKVAVQRRIASGKAKINPVAKRRAALLAKYQSSPHCLVQAAAHWRSERLLSEKPPKMPDPEELYVDEDNMGCRPLQLAARVPSTSIASLLLEKYADVKFTDTKKNNALIEASRSGDAQMVELLLANEADIRHRNKEDKRAVDCAANIEVREILEKAIVKKRVPPRPLFSAAKEEEKPPVQEEVQKPAIFRVRLERLPRQLEAELLRGHLRRLLRELGAGRPLSVEVLVDPITEKPRGVAFADFAEERAAEAALQGDGQEFLDREIAIERDLPMAMVR